MLNIVDDEAGSDSDVDDSDDDQGFSFSTWSSEKSAWLADTNLSKGT